MGHGRSGGEHLAAGEVAEGCETRSVNLVAPAKFNEGVTATDVAECHGLRTSAEIFTAERGTALNVTVRGKSERVRVYAVKG